MGWHDMDNMPLSMWVVRTPEYKCRGMIRMTLWAPDAETKILLFSPDKIGPPPKFLSNFTGRSKNRFKIGIYSKFSSTACSKQKYIYWKPKVFGYPTSRSYSNPPNPTGWRCTLCHPNWCSPLDKISLKGSKIAKFRQTAIMPRHLYLGVLGSSMKTTKIIYWMLLLCLLCVV